LEFRVVGSGAEEEAGEMADVWQRRFAQQEQAAGAGTEGA
jgi:hypothetical protein